MKKAIITLSLLALTLSSAAQSHENDYLIFAGLLGLGLALGDGHTSFGIHYHNGYYDYRGHRYSNRAAYLRAVESYERGRRNYQRQTIYLNNYYSGNSGWGYHRNNSDNRSNNYDRGRGNSNDQGSRSKRNNRSASRN